MPVLTLVGRHVPRSPSPSREILPVAERALEMAAPEDRFLTLYRECQIAVDFQQQDDGQWQAWWLALCGGAPMLEAPRTAVQGRFRTAEAAKDAGLAAAKRWVDDMKPW
jgi:hypothetical protein